MFDNTTRIAGAVLLGIFVIAGCGAQEVTSSGSPTSTPSPSPTTFVSPTQLAESTGCTILTDGEVQTILGGPAAATHSQLPDGDWCSWKPAGASTLTALELTVGDGEDRFDEAMGRAENGGGLHDTDEALGPLGFTTDDGQRRTVAWVRDDQSMVLTLTAGDASVEDLVVLAKAIDVRLKA